MRWTAALGALMLSAFITYAQSHAQSEVRFGVLGLFHPATLELQVSGDRPLSVVGNSSAFVVSGGSRRRLVLRADGNRVIAEQISASALHATARDGSDTRFELSIPGKIRRAYDGKLTITAHHGELIAVVTMNTETAVLSIVAAEMPANAPLEALKAQAVVTRSFLASGSRHSEYDFCDTTHCQFLRSPADASGRVLEAVNATRGWIIAFQHWPLAAMYASRCGGQTHPLRDLGMNPADGYPYYSVRCEWCRQHPVRWQTRMQPGDDAPSSGNEAARIAHAREWGWSTIPGNAFSLNKDENGILITGQSIGHGVGLCQFGAIGMAQAGADFRSILAHYYPNTEVTVLR